MVPDSASDLFVLSVRDPQNFFNYRHFSLLTQDESTRDTLSQVQRHDRVCIQGKFIPNPSPQKHISVTSVQILDQWSGLTGFPDEHSTTTLPDDLRQHTSFVGKVHAIAESGRILVVEYKDKVVPVFVTATRHTKDLFRGDIVRIAYRIQPWPPTPTHLNLNADAERPLEVLDSMAAWNGRPARLVGTLVKFPQSPQLKFDVYAIEVETRGVNRYFTLVNFEDGAKFEQIRTKLAQIWDQQADTAELGRNVLRNPAIKIEVNGQANVASPAQANPQILLNSADDIRRSS